MVTICSDGELACPKCGELNLHQSAPVILPAENGYPRGGGMVINFWCEHCDNAAPLRLQIGQHKGTTYVEWLRPSAPTSKT